MINTSQEWKNLLSTEDILPEGNVNIFSDSAVLDTSAFTVSATNKASFSDVNFMAKAPRIINREQRNIATLEWNYWVLDGTYEIPTEDTAINEYVSEEISDINGIFENAPTISLVPSSSPMINPSVYTVEFKNGFGTSIETPQATTTTKKHMIEEQENKYVYLETDYTQGIGVPFIKINRWSMPYRRARVSEFLLGARIFFDKSNLSKFQHQRTGDMINAELPQNDATVTVIDENADYDMYNPNAKFAKLLSTYSLFDIYYGYNLNGSWEYIKVDQLYLSSLDRPQNGMEAKFVLESSLNRETNTFKTTEQILFYTYEQLINLINAKVNGSIALVGGNFTTTHKEQLSVGLIGALSGDFFEIPMKEMLQMVSSVINAYIYRNPNGNYQLVNIYNNNLNTITNTNPIDTITLENCFKYPEIEPILDIGNISLTTVKYPKEREDNTADSEWLGSFGGVQVAFPPYRNSQSYGVGVEETIESSLIVFYPDTTTGKEYNFTLSDGIHTSYMNWVHSFISGAKRINVNTIINPAWQIGDLLSVELKDGTYVKGFLINTDIEFAGYPKGNITILAPKSLNS